MTGNLQPAPAANGLAARKPLAAVLNSSGRDSVLPGAPFELGVTVSNDGSESAVIHIYIDERSPQLRQWCSSMQERLALAPNQSGEVTFLVQVPEDAMPEVLEYDLVVDGSDYYPDVAPLRFKSRQLQVLPADVGQLRSGEPVFFLEPRTFADQPAKLQPGGEQLIMAWVDNRTDRVDRFRLTCTGLPESWEVTIIYPRDSEGLGLVLEADSLGLNPGDRQQILLRLRPPLEAPANIYVPVVQLYSKNNPELHLMDLIYLQVEPIYLLQPAIQILRSQVHRRPALFEVELVNAGNTPRTVALQLQSLDEDGSCLYTLDPQALTILPKTTGRAQIEGRPQRWWRRPLYGSGRVSNFRVEIIDADALPLSIKTLQGNLMWMPRPWWQLLLVVLAVLGLLGALIWLIWWTFFRPPVLPEILEFSAEDSTYAAASQDVARVSWQIQRPDRIQVLKITGYGADGSVISGPLVYDLSQSLPAALQPFCEFQQALLTCRNVRTDATRPGEYVFELTLVPKRRRGEELPTAQTSPVQITPAPTATVVDFMADQLVYAETAADSGNTSGIQLSWMVTEPEDLAALRLVGRNAEGKSIGEIWYEFGLEGDRLTLPPSLEAYCEIAETLVCESVPTRISQVGEYVFELTAISRQAPDATAEAQTTEAITVEPQPLQIQAFLINGEPAQPKYLIPIEPGQSPPVLTFSWLVTGGATTDVKLLPVPEDVPPTGSVTLPINISPGSSSTITLQASDASGATISQAVTIETFDPTPLDPAEIAAAAAAAAAQATEAAAAGSPAAPGSAPPPPPPGAPLPAAPGRIAPAEAPPQFD